MLTQKQIRQAVYYANAWCDEYSSERPFRAKDFVGLLRSNRELRALLAEALPNLDGYVVMAADKPGSLWSRIHAALADKQ